MPAARYNKLIMALAGVAVTAIQQSAGRFDWRPVLIGLVTAFLVWLAPNSPAGPPP